MEAIVFKPVYPPRYDSANLTYFGGYPTLSRRLAWPLSAETGRPITFIGQVDLSTLPRITQGRALPSAGVLHFFGNDRDDALETAVLFSSDASEHLVETAPPKNMRNLYDEYPWSSKQAWATRSVRRLDAYAKWWMEPVVCVTHPAYNEADDAADDEANDKANDETFSRTFPFPMAIHTLAPFPEKKAGNPVDLWIPDSEFPYLWAFIEAWCSQLLGEEPYLRITSRQEPDPDMARECVEWIRLAQSHGRFARTTADVVGEFWRWVRSLDARRKRALPGDAIADYGLRIANGQATWLDQVRLRALLARPALAWREALQTIPRQAKAIAAGRAAEPSFLSWLDGHVRDMAGTATLNKVTQRALRVITNLVLARGEESARAIPPAAIEYNRKLHWPTAARHHQMFGHRQMVYQYVDEQLVDPYLKTHRLLMQFSSSDGLDWTWGDSGEFYFWITDDDLEHRRFDRVLSRIEGN